MEKDLKHLQLEKLTESNYSIWKIMMTSHLKARGLWQVCTEPPSPKLEITSSMTQEEKELVLADQEMSMREQERAKALLYSALGTANAASTGFCETAHDLWEKIITNFEGDILDRRSQKLLTFMNLRYEKGEKFVEYCGRYETALNDLLMSGAHIDEENKLFVFTKTLPKDIKTTARNYRISNRSASIQSLLSHVKTEVLRDKCEEREENLVALMSNLSTQERKPKREEEKTSDNPNLSKETCTFCKKQGHVWQKCRKRLQRRQAREEKKKNSGPKPKEKSSTEYTALTAHSFLVKEESQSSDWKTRFESNSTYWIVDSEASDHITSHGTWLSDEDDHTSSHQVKIGDGKALHIKGIGTLNHKSGTKLVCHQRSSSQKSS